MEEKFADPDFLSLNANREYAGEVLYDNSNHAPWSHPKIRAYPIRYRNGKCEVFDFDEGRYRSPYSYSKKQKRLFHRTYSGLQVGYYLKQILIFLTLTTFYEKKENDPAFNAKSKRNALLNAERRLNDHWQKFKQNLEYKIQMIRFSEWLLETYGLDIDNPNNSKEKRREIKRLRRYNFRRFKFKLNYEKGRTTEGGGVLHILIRKNSDIPKFPIEWMKQEWDRIHGADQVFVEKIDVDPEMPLNDALNASFYFCGNYFNQQPVVRQSSSYSWIFKGAAQVWVRGKTILGIKKKNVEYEPSREYENEYGDVERFTKKTQKPNILLLRESLIQHYCNHKKPSLYDMAHHKIFEPVEKPVNGYDRAKIQWLQLLKNPPKSTSQTRLASKSFRRDKKPLVKPIFKFNSFGGFVFWG